MSSQDQDPQDVKTKLNMSVDWELSHNIEFCNIKNFSLFQKDPTE